MVFKNKKTKKVLITATLLVGCFLALPSFAQETQDYYYQTIKVDIQVNSDSTFDVTEEQTYRLNGSFGYFYRDIELKDLDHISNIQVYNSENQLLGEDEYEDSYNGNRRVIAWNFPRRVFDDELKSWTLKYKVHGGLKFLKDHDEIYWNAIFADRTVPVAYAEAIVHLPVPVEKESLLKTLYVGRAGSNTQSTNYQIIDDQAIKFWGYNLEGGEFLTVAVGWPKGLVEKPLLYRNQIINSLAVFMAVLFLLFNIVTTYRQWAKTGKDPKMRKTIIAQYKAPDKLSPAIIGVLVDQRVDIKDITASIVDLAVRGYLKIHQGEKTLFAGQQYIFEKLKDFDSLPVYERKILKGIFSFANKRSSKDLFKDFVKAMKEGEDVKSLKKEKRVEAIQLKIDKWSERLDRPISAVSSNDLKNKFYQRIPAIKKEIHKAVQETGFFTGNIEKIRQKYQLKYFLMCILGVAGIIAGIALFGFFGSTMVGLVIIAAALLISGIVGLIIAYYMPALTPRGLEAKWQWLGFKQYLDTAERFRIGVETLETFSKYLPYAMVFGVEKK